MSDYTPDRWVIIRITTDTERLYKVFASWSGGYTGSDSWKMNSGITQANLVDDRWEFTGYSGSVYSCYLNAYGTNFYGNSVLQRMISQAQEQGFNIEIMPETTNWAGLDYDPLQQFIKDGANGA
jgi:hypothetical protein